MSLALRAAFGAHLPVRPVRDPQRRGHGSLAEYEGTEWQPFLDGLSLPSAVTAPDAESGLVPFEVLGPGGTVYKSAGPPLGQGSMGMILAMAARGEPLGGDPLAFVLKMLPVGARYTEHDLRGVALAARARGQLPLVEGSVLWAGDPNPRKGGTPLWRDLTFIAMPALDATMRDLADRGNFTKETAAGVVTAIALAAARLRELGVMLNDMKAENVMFKTPEPGGLWIPRIVDFGTLIGLEDDAFSNEFCPPEQVSMYVTGHGGRVDADESSTVWQLGMLLLSVTLGPSSNVNAYNSQNLAILYENSMAAGNSADEAVEDIYGAVGVPVLISTDRGKADPIHKAALQYALGRPPRTLDGLLAILDRYESKEHLLAFPSAE